MSCSIALLLILQVLWLRNSYEKAFYDLRRDTNFIFRNTIYTLRDSLFSKNIRPISADSIKPSTIESVQIWNQKGSDSMRILTRTASTVQVYVNASGDKDSIIRSLRPMTHKFNRAGSEGQSFVIRLSPDTIKLDTLTTVFKTALENSGLPIKFSLKQIDVSPTQLPTMRMQASTPDVPHRNVFRDTVFLDAVRLNPISSYSATLVEFRGFILKQIAPQILFSILLTVVTVIAFFVMYKSLRTQQRLMDLKNDFISNVSHELKTPVATVSVALEALKNFHALNDPKLTQEYLDIAQKELNRLTLMTDKILKSAVFESKGITIQNEPVDLATITAQVIDSMKLVFEKHKAETNFTTEGEDFIVEGSTAHLTNVIYNLVDNALKYSPLQPRLSVHIKDNHDNVVLTVQDNGLGIAPEYKKKIFEKFFRVPTGDIHNIKGYGLGLSYVASVVKEHGGTIDVVSEEGKGSTFIIHLPKIHE